MKTKLQLTIAAFALAVISQNVTAQTVTYDFNTNLNGVVTAEGAGIRERGIPGTAPVPVLTDNGVPNTTGVLIQRQYNLFPSNRNTNVNDLTLFPAATDYSITWKEYVRQVPDGGTTSHRRGFIVRGKNAGSATYAPGLRSGYYVGILGNNNGSINFQVRNVVGDNLSQIGVSPAIYLNGGTNPIVANTAYWYRVSVIGSSPVVIKFEYSLDGTSFTTGFTYSDANNLYTEAGFTQTVSGIGFASYDWHFLDDIVFNTGSSLGTKDLSLNEKSISVVKKDNDISINSSEITIKSVQLFDVTGRVIASKNNINALETLFTNLSFGKGLVLVQITGSDESVVTRKLVY